MNQELKEEIKIYGNECDLKKAIRQKCTDENLNSYKCPYASTCNSTCEFCLEEEKKINEKLLKGLIIAGLAVSIIGVAGVTLSGLTDNGVQIEQSYDSDRGF